MFRRYRQAAKCYAYMTDELVAPREMVFLASDWSEIGARKELSYKIEQIMKIVTALLLGKSRLEESCIAKRDNAFICLQEEIMKDSDDETLFAWESDGVSNEKPCSALVGIGIRSKPNSAKDEDHFVRIKSTLIRDVPFSMLLSAVLDTVYIPKTFVGVLEDIAVLQDQDSDAWSEGDYEMPDRILHRRIQPRGH
ncbi:hypothetical protein N7499_008982 [Penicillium canescens]|nr:hypothetical protein N7499_008982 [Penicillium canescens]KAJ6159312.1 hypothetical protein N7485_012138 [Penicillium canescens]